MNKSTDSVGARSTHKFVVIHWMEDLDSAHRMMKAIESRHLPVIDDSGELIGMLSDRDIQRAMRLMQVRRSSLASLDHGFEPDALVRDYMSWPLATIEESQPVAQAAQMMIEHKISALVVTRVDVAVGVVTTEDLLRTLLNENKGVLQTLKENVTSAIFNSPIGGIAQGLSNAGL